MIRNCPDCGVEPGQCHLEGCDVEYCSACGTQRLSCLCNGQHDPCFARWSGWWPGELEARDLGIDLNEFHARRYAELLFKKPATLKRQIEIIKDEISKMVNLKKELEACLEKSKTG